MLGQRLAQQEEIAMDVKVEGNELVVRLPLHSPRASKSGKALIVAGTGGFQKTGVEVAGKEVSISINAIVKK